MGKGERYAGSSGRSGGSGGRSAKEGWDSRNLEVRMGRCQRSMVERSVGKVGHSKRWMVVSSDRLQWGQEGEGVLVGSMRCW